MKISVKRPKDERWLTFMKLGAKTGCHQMPERSFSFGGYQFPICARCTGVILGYIIAVITYFKHGFHKRSSIAGCGIMLTDWAVQWIGIKESSNRRRVLTGIAGGFGIMSLQLELLRKIKQKLWN